MMHHLVTSAGSVAQVYGNDFTAPGETPPRPATSDEPAKTVHKVKAKAHKAKARHAGSAAKTAAKETVK